MRKIPLSPLLAAGAVAGYLSHTTPLQAEDAFVSRMAAEVAAVQSSTWLSGETVVLPGRTFFTGGSTGKLWMVDSSTRRELYVTDGTTAGTRLIGGSSGLQLSGPLLVHDGQVWFRGWTAGSGEPRLFRTDGTEAGTVVVCSLAPVEAATYTLVEGPVSAGGRIYFAFRKNGGSAVLQCDPVTGQTVFIPVPLTGLQVLMADEDDVFFRDSAGVFYHVPQPGGNFAAPAVVSQTASVVGQSGGWIWFYTFEINSSGQKLTFRKTNGQTTISAAEGAVFVWGSGGAVEATAAHGRLFLNLTGGSGVPGATGVWVTDGTAAGTLRLISTRAVRLAPVEGDRIAVLTEGASGGSRDLWAATATGAWLVQSGVADSEVVAVPGGVALVQRQPGLDMPPRTVWTSSLAPGPLRVAGVVPGIEYSSTLPQTIPLHDGALILAQVPEAGIEPWVLKGVSTAPRCLRNLGREITALASLYGEAGGKLIYRSRELYSTAGDGSSALLAGMTNQPVDETNQDRFLTVSAGGQLYFTAKNLSWISTVDELFRTDGTAAGTRDLDAPGASDLRAAGSTVFMPAVGGLRYCGPADTGAALTSFTASSSFVGEGSHASSVYIRGSDGTVHQVRENGVISPVGAPSTQAGDVVVFDGVDAASGREPWRTDGTAAGTFRLVDANPGAASSYLHPAVKVGAEWWILTRNGADLPVKLWSTDGTAAGTQLRVEMPAAAFPAGTKPPLSADGRIFFLNGAGKIWTTDGTLAGTREVGAGSWLAVWRGRLFYNSYTAGAGNELWTSDGTAAGTYMVEDLWPGADGSNPRALTVAGDRLYYLTVLPLGTTGYSLPQIRVLNAVPQTTYDAWTAAAGLTGGSALPLGSPLGDGVPNLLKYAFNLNPLSPDRRTLTPGASAGLPRVELADVKGVAVLNITFLQRPAAGLTYTVQSSADLLTWTPVSGGLRDTPVPGAPGWEECTMSVALDGRIRYLRVAVELAAP